MISASTPVLSLFLLPVHLMLFSHESKKDERRERVQSDPPVTDLCQQELTSSYLASCEIGPAGRSTPVRVIGSADRRLIGSGFPAKKSTVSKTGREYGVQLG